MSTVYETNLRVMRKHSALFPKEVFDELAKEQREPYTLAPEPAKKQGETFAVSMDGKTFTMHSAYDPVHEAEVLVKEIEGESEYDLVVVIGVGAGYVVREVLRKRGDIDIIAYEPSYYMFRFLLETFDLSDILSDCRVTYFIGENQLNDIEFFLSMHSTRKVKIFTLRGYHRLYPASVANIQEGVLAYVDKKSINLNTMSRFERLWAYNIIHNVNSIPFQGGINTFFNAFPNVPAVVISAGPSLEKNIDVLHEMKERAILVAVDTALKPLAHHGITPHFVIAVDPQGKNAKYFQGVDTKEITLIAEASIHNEILRGFEGPVFFVESIFPLAKYLMGFLGERGEVNMGGSVSTTAFDFARLMGCDPLIMVGLDLSYPKHRTHISGSYHEEDYFTKVTRLSTFDSKIYALISEGGLRPAKNIYGEPVYVDSRFVMYRGWYERQVTTHPDVTVYNATEGGVPITGMTNETLVALADRLPTRKITLAPFLERARVDKETEHVLRTHIQKGFTHFRDELREIDALTTEALSLVDTLEKRVAAKENVSRILSTLADIDGRLAAYEGGKLLIGITMQRVINFIKEGYSFDENAPKEMRAVINSRHLYKEMRSSARFNDRLLAFGAEHLLRSAS